MDFQERQRLVRRICNRKLYGRITYQNQEISLIFNDPSLDIMSQSDDIYYKSLNEYKQSNCLTLDESYKILEKDGKWSKKLENELTKLQKDLTDLNIELNNNKFNKTAQRAFQKEIDKNTKRINELWQTKNQLMPATIEYLSSTRKQNFIISHITNLSNQFERFLNNSNFQNILRVYYFEDNGISEKRIREVARTDPWRLYWSSSKDTGTPLFPHSLVEMTDLQYQLVLWSKIYDFAYENTNRPTDDIIQDDSKFDSWYKAEIERREKEINSSNLNGLATGQEVFVVTDREGAKELYEMNTLESKAKILERQRAITEKGQLTEANLPDVKRELIFEANKMKNKGM